jgi:inhibitor of cysteine peptidase
MELNPDQYKTDLALLLEKEEKHASRTAVDVITRRAGINEVNIEMSLSPSVKVNAVVSGYLSDGCTTLESIDQARHEEGFEITITTRRPAGMNCPQVIMPFEEIISLDVSGLKAGVYTVTVNGRLSRTFMLPVDVSPRE